MSLRKNCGLYMFLLNRDCKGNMEFDRKQYLEKIISKMHNGRVKIITGLRRCGKSYLLFNLFTRYLRSNNISDDQIISLALDDFSNARLRNPFTLHRYLKDKISDNSKQYYILIDEIQLVEEVQNPYVNFPTAKLTFVDLLLEFMKLKNVDLYVTGSNSKMLSGDILTQFRDRGDVIHIYPISFAELSEAYQGSHKNLWLEYYTYGGMPYIFQYETHEEKSRYLKDLFQLTYVKDILERHAIQNEISVLDDMLNILASSTGSLTNPKKLANTFLSEKQVAINSTTISKYLRYMSDAFLISEAHRYDIKGKKYMTTPLKYYFSDVGLRNARLGFRQLEENHIMENIIYCDLIRRGYDVDVGIVEYNIKTAEGKKVRKQLEVDFVVNRIDQRFYIQSTFSVADPDKRKQELNSLMRIPDFFKRIVVVRDYIQPWRDDTGILYIGVEQFLLTEDISAL